MLPSTLLLATTNPNKVREIRALLEGLSYAIAGLDGFPGVPPPEETAPSFAENAALKAHYYAELTGQATIAEDSGLEVDALDGLPGVESARFGGPATSYPEKFERLYAMLDARGARDSPARFVCAVALAWEGRILFATSGTIEGRISPQPRGTGGFGYDPIFFYAPDGCTLAEQSDERKRAVSHRGVAFRALREFLAAEPRQ